MAVALGVLGLWVVAALLQAMCGDSLAARRWRQERERRERDELRALCQRIQDHEDQAEQRRWSKR